MQKMLKEINEIYSTEDIPTNDNLNKLNYIYAVLKETLRHYSPAPGPLSRVSLKEHTLGDLTIKAQIGIRPNPVYNMFNPRYVENPLEFDPDRWMRDDKQDPYLFVPFSAGPRNCIGQHLAVIESKIILCEFLKRFRYETEKDYELKMIVQFVYENEKPIYLKLEKR